MSMTVGYWSGYFAGICTGTLVGWIMSVLLGRGDSEDEDFENEVDLEELLESSNPEGNTSDPNTEGINVMYFRFTDKALADILTRLGTNMAGLNSSDVVPPSAPTKDATSSAEATTSTEQDPNVLQSETIGEDEMEYIFDEADTAARVQGKTVDEILDVGRNMPTRPVSYLTSTTGGYATMGQLEDIGKKHAEYKNATLKRSDELEIIHAFRGIVGQKYYDAQEMVKGQGYTLHPLYFGKGRKHPAQIYSATTLGVRVEDSSADEGVPSIDAVVTEIIDVGGIDAKNRGAK